METSLYEKMKARGIDMSWYEKGNKRNLPTETPLEDGECSKLSIYIIKKNGTLWTIDSSGNPYYNVRPGSKEIERDVYVCLHCKQQFKDMPVSHKPKSDF